MGMHILSGSDFLPSDSIYTSQLNFIATQDLQKESGIPAGETLDFFPWGMSATLKGYVNNVQFTSLKTGSVPYIFCPNGIYSNNVLPFAYIRVKAGSNMDSALKHIRQTMSECFTGYPTEVKFYDQIYGQLYQRNKPAKDNHLVQSAGHSHFTGRSIRTDYFEAAHRRKEIGVRKVYGASTGQILWMFGRSYLTLSIVCSLLASPIAWYAVSEWLKQFNEKSLFLHGYF